MSSEPTITLATSDHGNITLPEPSWCAGHTHHDPETLRADLDHSGPAVQLNHRYTTLLSACLTQSAYTADAASVLGGRTPGVSVWPLGDTLNPSQLYDLAARLDAYADQLRALGDQLGAILAEADQ
ncbi:DUF6907 domain-containing protein [Streptomyces chartreusis]|uniref:DUF6907 domain-containing protein n=1 Tax=Streptomyces chartreusis TaxID=1969 RepID=UPI003631E1F1